jgi:PAS domain-containing protein
VLALALNRPEALELLHAFITEQHPHVLHVHFQHHGKGCAAPACNIMHALELSHCCLVLLCLACRVLERYPDSGKLLKVYGRFFEFVQNDPAAARHYYAAAMHHGTSDSMVKMVSSALAVAGSSSAGAPAIDEKSDGLVIINAQGLMLLVNPAARCMFGYGKGEMEGKNISVLM